MCQFGRWKYLFADAADAVALIASYGKAYGIPRARGYPRQWRLADRKKNRLSPSVFHHSRNRMADYMDHFAKQLLAPQEQLWIPAAAGSSFNRATAGVRLLEMP